MALCTKGLQLHTQRHAEYMHHEYHHTNILQVTPSIPQNQPKLNPCYKTLARTLTVPLYGALCTEGLQLHTQIHAEYIYLEYHHTNIFQVTPNVPENQLKLNPCCKTLGRTLTAPLYGTLCTEGLQLHTQRHAEYIYAEHHHINIFQITLNAPQNQLKLNPCYKTLGRTLMVPLQGTLSTEELKPIGKDMQNIYTLNITTYIFFK